MTPLGNHKLHFVALGAIQKSAEAIGKCLLPQMALESSLEATEMQFWSLLEISHWTKSSWTQVWGSAMNQIHGYRIWRFGGPTSTLVLLQVHSTGVLTVRCLLLFISLGSRSKVYDWLFLHDSETYYVALYTIYCTFLLLYIFTFSQVIVLCVGLDKHFFDCYSLVFIFSL